MTKIADLLGLADHARLSHRYWLRTARNGGSGDYGPAYCIAGAATWRRRLAEILGQIKRRREAIAKASATRRIRAAERGARQRAIQDRALAAAG